MEVAQNGFGILIQFIEYQIELFNQPVAGHAQPFYYHFIVVIYWLFPYFNICFTLFQKEVRTIGLRFQSVDAFIVLGCAYSI